MCIDVAEVEFGECGVEVGGVDGGGLTELLVGSECALRPVPESVGEGGDGVEVVRPKAGADEQLLLGLALGAQRRRGKGGHRVCRGNQ